MPLFPGLLLASLVFAPPAASIAAKPPAPKPKPTPAPIKLPADVAARVGDHDITRDELMDSISSVGVRDAISQWLQQKIAIEREAKKFKVTLSDAELAKKLLTEKEKVVQNAIQATGNPMTFAQVQTTFGVTVPEMEYRIRLNLLANKTYDAFLLTQVPPIAGRRKLAHILIATIPLQGGAVPMTPEEQKKKEDDALAKIQQIQADIKAKKMTFEQAAAKFSDDKGPDGRGSASKGGALPFTQRGVYDPAFEKAGWSLGKSGDVSAPIKSQFGWHLIKLIRKGEEATPAEKYAYSQETIAAAKADPRGYTTWLNGLIRAQAVTYNLDFQLVPKKAKGRK
jgi:hypothetical protein